MKYLLDSNICILLLSGRSASLQTRVLECDEDDLVISSITFAEIALGSRNGKLPPLFVLDAFAQQVPVLPFDHLAAKLYAQLPFRRRSFDRLIAAHALSLKLVLVTDNVRDFSDIDGLRVENWTL